VPKDTINSGGNALTIVAPIAAPANAAIQPVHPEFIRLPKNGLCPWTGLSRAKLNELVLPCAANGHKPPVRSVCLRKPANFPGVRKRRAAGQQEFTRERDDARTFQQKNAGEL